MKKMFFYASLLLAAATLNSCSQDSDLSADEAATAAAGALTPEQKAQIMELAEYYDLDVTIDDRPVTRGVGQEFNIDSINETFQKMANLKGEYVCVSSNGQEAIFRKSSSSSKLGIRRLTIPVPEEISGSFEEWDNARGHDFKVTVNWTYIGGGGTVTVGVECPALSWCVIETRNVQWIFTGQGPSFVFSCDAIARDIQSWKIEFKYKISGDYSVTTDSGSVTVS